MPYPTDDADRIAFWTAQIKFASSKIDPYLVIGNNLVKIYNNMSATTREKELDATIEGKENIGRIKAGLIFSWVDQSIADLLDRTPVFTVTPNNRDSVKGAPAVQAAINYWATETQQFHHDKRCLLDAFLMPYGVKKIGWKSRILEKEVSIGDLSDNILDDPEQESNAMSGGIITRVTDEQDHTAHIEQHTRFLQDPTIPDEIKSRIIKPNIDDHKWYQENPSPDSNTTIQYEAPFGVRWNPKDFRMDGYAQDCLNDARWIGWRFRKPLYEMQNGRYDNTNDLKPSQRISTMTGASGEDLLGFDEFGIVEGWEVWARDFPVGRVVGKGKYAKKYRDVLLTFVEGYENLLQHDEEWPYENIENYPAEVVMFQSGVDSWYNKPSISLAGGDNIQSLTNEALDSMLYTVRKQKNIFLYDPGVIKQEEMDTILDLPDGSVIAIEGLADAGNKAIVAIPFVHIPGEKNQIFSILQSVYDKAMGTPQPLTTQTNETATEVNIRDKRVTAREEARGNAFKQFQINTARKFWQLHSQFLPENEFLIDPRLELWGKIDQATAKGEYRFRIDISSRAVAEAVEAKKYLDLLNLLVGVTPTLLQTGYGHPDFMEIINRLLMRGYGIQDPESILPSLAQDPSVQQAMKDPNFKIMTANSLSGMQGGGNMISGAGPGPVNPQQFAAQPQQPTGT